MIKRYDRKFSYATAVFFVMFVYYIWQQGTEPIAVAGFVGIAVVWLGFTQRYYTVEKRDLVVHYFLKKNKVFPIMEINTIVETTLQNSGLRLPPRGSMDIFMQDGRRICVIPKDRIAFLKNLERINKRIFIQVPEYNDTKKKF